MMTRHEDGWETCHWVYPDGWASCTGTVRRMPYPSDRTDEQRDLLEPVPDAPGKRGRRHADDLRSMGDAMLYIAQTTCGSRLVGGGGGVCDTAGDVGFRCQQPGRVGGAAAEDEPGYAEGRGKPGGGGDGACDGCSDDEPDQA